MTLHTIGEVSLSLSTFVYLIWLVPQIRLNFKRRSTEGLSFWLHSLLLFGYCFDLVYGFGRHMEWQYRLVTIAGLLTLGIQHVQFACYGHSVSKKLYFSVSAIALILLTTAITLLFTTTESKAFYDWVGMLSNLCYWVYMFPQIVKNFTGQSTKALSLQFICLSLLITACDFTSAATLNWDWPSFIGPVFGLSFKLTLLFQIFYYRAPHAKTATA